MFVTKQGSLLVNLFWAVISSSRSDNVTLYLSLGISLYLLAGLQKDRDRGTAGPKEGLSSIGSFGLKG